jgi:hypothetical protein
MGLFLVTPTSLDESLYWRRLQGSNPNHPSRQNDWKEAHQRRILGHSRASQRG